MSGPCPNKGQLGAVKNELGCLECEEAVFLASKTYALKIKDHDYTRAKGIPRSIVSQYRYEQFRKMLFEPHQHSETFSALRAQRLTSVKQELTKKALAFENDKVYLWKPKLKLRSSAELRSGAAGGSYAEGSSEGEYEPFCCRPHGHWRNGRSLHEASEDTGETEELP